MLSRRFRHNRKVPDGLVQPSDNANSGRQQFAQADRQRIAVSPTVELVQKVEALAFTDIDLTLRVFLFRYFH